MACLKSSNKRVRTAFWGLIFSAALISILPLPRTGFASEESDSIEAGWVLLSPPWIVLENQVKATLAVDPDVSILLVNLGNGQFLLKVQVKNLDKAKALSAFLSRVVEFGKNHVTIQVLDPQGQVVPGSLPSDPNLARTLITTALGGNPYFVGIQDGWGPYSFFVEFKKQVIQFSADNISDYYKNENWVAEKSFFYVLGFDRIQAFHFGSSTSIY